MAEMSKRALASSDSQAYVSALTGLMAPLSIRAIGQGFSNAFSLGRDRNRPSVELPGADSASLANALCAGLNGYTARDLIAQPDSVSARVGIALERSMALSHIALLTDARNAYDLARDSLALFKVEAARLIQESGYIGLESTIVLTVRNETPYHISRAYFTAVAISEGREVPWLDEEFNYSIAGGLAPGETARWRLTPNSFQGNWGKVRVPATAKFIVEVKKLDGADGESLWGGVSFTRGDQRVLDSLSALTR